MRDEQLGMALRGADLVIILVGVPRKPGMSRDDLFNTNAGIIKSLCSTIAKYCHNALVNMISNPVNSTVPIATEVFKKAGTYDEKKLFGVTMLDVVRAKTFYAGKAKVPVANVNVPVVGGHAGITILPLFSHATPKANLSDEDIKALTKRTQDGGTEVVEAKAGKGSATLSMAYAGAIFADACLKGLNGVPNVIECSFVQSTITELPFFASKVIGLNLPIFKIVRIYYSCMLMCNIGTFFRYILFFLYCITKGVIYIFWEYTKNVIDMLAMRRFFRYILYFYIILQKVRLGKNGVEEVLGLGPPSDYEKQGLESLMPELKTSIEKGIKFANQ
ncbi:malate dehydrogenase, mitochondrial-like [Camellia sinensis]|uniref:malate dehydrogenase, mitochondrial-like n=1 Tax=Camellia sinensis TaxID=4442 RepID=UPI0010363962|nr:malate dehydrogenase, mitochondrial-like [Camellia sinensis]